MHLTDGEVRIDDRGIGAPHEDDRVTSGSPGEYQDELTQHYNFFQSAIIISILYYYITYII